MLVCIKYILSHEKCGSSFLKAKRKLTMPVDDETNRYLSNEEYESIRIHLDYSFIENNMAIFKKDDLNALKERIMPKTKEVWESILKVKRLKGKLKFDSDYCDNFKMPEEYLINGKGVNADLVIFVMIDDSGFFLENQIEAAAIHCLQHSVTRRPLAGFIQFKPDLKVNNSTASDYMAWLAIHETTHVLTMNDSLYNDFITENGTLVSINNVVGKKTIEKRVNPAETISFIQKSNLRFKQVETIKRKNIKFVMSGNDNNEVKAFEFINKASYSMPNRISSNTEERTISYIKTKRVLERAKHHFGCDSLEGVPLEYNGGPGTAGAHWSKRYMNTDYMIGDSYGENLISDITLALFEDSGWYKVDYTKSNLFLWGKNKTCEFFKEDCTGTKADNSNLFSEFCSKPNADVCSFHNIFRGSCKVKEYNAELPISERHFTNNKLGGVDMLVDKCPIAIETRNGQNYYGGSCRVGKKNNKHEKVCPECSCFIQSDSTNNNDTALCFEFKCKNNALFVTIEDKEYQCPENRIIRNITGLENKVIKCPDKEVICNDKYLCKFGCTDKYSNSSPFQEYK